jgi:pyruvate/2-oxoglutarate dehydrogenase complex dihydrolipoamide acyltransferase (E2) component
MSFEFTVRGHAADPHNDTVKAEFDRAVVNLRRQFGTAGSVSGGGYSTDPSGTLEFDATGSVDALAILAANAEQTAVDQATAEAAVAQAKAKVQAAQDEQKGAEAVLAATKKAPKATAAEEDTTDDGVNATDAAVARAKELKIDISTVKGTGTDGRVLVSDVDAAASA